MSEPAPLALQLAVRMERGVPRPAVGDICRATALATVALLRDPRSHPGGPWHDEVAAWNGARIRKIVRRGRASAWERAHEADGITVGLDGVEVRAFVPGPTDQLPPAVAKLQIQSTDLDPPTSVSELGDHHGLVIAVTPHVAMSWGKQAAQCAHAAQRAWMTASSEDQHVWARCGFPLTVVHPDPDAWRSATERATTAIHDGGFTEIPAGTNTTCAWWVDARPNDHTGASVSRQEVRLGGPNEARIGLSRAVRVGDHVAVGGTAAINEDGTNVDPDDLAAQARRIWEIIGAALHAAGADVSDIVRTRTMLVDRNDFAAVTAVRKEILGSAMPTDTIVEVSGFIDPDWKVEIEVDAIIATP